MKFLLRFRSTILALMLVLGATVTLTGCLVDTDWHDDDKDHSDLYR